MEPKREDFATDAEYIQALKTFYAGLVANQATLKAQIATLNKNKSTLTEEELAELKEAKTKLDEIERQKAETDKDYQKQLKLAKEQKDEADTKLAAATKRINKMTIDHEVRKALGKHQIIPQLLKSAVMLISSDCKIGAEDAVMVGSETVDAHVTKWITTDEGKAYVGLDISGGGAGSEQKKYDSAAVHWSKEGWNVTEQMKVQKSNSELYSVLKKKFPNRPIK
jgi:hypothetical protein